MFSIPINRGHSKPWSTLLKNHNWRDRFKASRVLEALLSNLFKYIFMGFYKNKFEDSNFTMNKFFKHKWSLKHLWFEIKYSSSHIDIVPFCREELDGTIGILPPQFNKTFNLAIIFLKWNLCVHFLNVRVMA